MVYDTYTFSRAALPVSMIVSSFTEEAIKEHTNESDMGIYLILSYSRNCWVYIGEGEIRDRLLRHLSNDEVLGYDPSGWMAIRISGREARLEREKKLIQDLDPVVNRHHRK